VRLARRGHVTEVRIDIAKDTPHEAIRSALAEITAPPEALQAVPAETVLGAANGAQGEGPLPSPREAIPGSDNRFPEQGMDALQDRILGILAEGPSHARLLASRLHCRVAALLAALHGLEEAGCVARSRQRGRGARWALASR
jgi:hypothetical protein